jgi:hypothetical protein
MTEPNKRHYLVLLSMNESNAIAGRATLKVLKEQVDHAAHPLWIDGHGVAAVLTTTLPAIDVWAIAADSADQSFNDALVLEVGRD